MNETVKGLINDRWELMLTPDRVEFHAARKVQGWERPRLESCHSLIQPGMTVWDIGAECGDFTTLYRSWVGDTGKILAVEPQPAYWPSIYHTWTANFSDIPDWYVGFISDNIDEYPPHDKLARTRRAGPNGWPLCSRGPVIPDYGFRHLAQQASSTPQITIDALAARFHPPDAIVMDIEGAEYRALQGAVGLLKNLDVLVWVSCHPVPMGEWYNVTMDDLHSLMRGYGYEGVYLGQETELFYLYARSR